MTRTIATTLLLLLSTAVHAQQPIPRSTPPAIPAPGQTIMTPPGNITRTGPYVQYPNGSSAIVNQQGLTTWSNGQGCRTYSTTTYCW